jgi:hypothetical protein
MQTDLFDAPPDPPPQRDLPQDESNAEPQPDACYWDFCPNCSARLHNAGCKYRCPRCFYFMSCSDFD